MSDCLQIVLEQKNIAKENAALLLEAYGAPFTEAGTIIENYKSIVVTDESQTDLMKEAGEKRKALKKIRTGVENKRKELKENINAQAQAIDGVARYIKETIQPAEEYLELQEKFAEVKAAERATKLKSDRIEQLAQYSDNLSIYNFDTMTDSTFATLLAELKGAHEAKIAEAARLKKEREEAEEDERKRQAEIAAENERLRVEAAKRDKKEAEEKKAREAAESKRRATQAKKDAAAKAERDRIQKEADEKIAAERAKSEKLEKEKRQREADEAAAKAKAEEDERQALLAPDKEKLKSFVAALDMIRTQKLPAVKTQKAQDIINIIDSRLTELEKTIVEQIEHL